MWMQEEHGHVLVLHSVKKGSAKSKWSKKWLQFLYTQKGVQEDIEKAKQRQNAAITKLREVQQNDRQYRDEMLIKLAKTKAKPWNMKEEAAVKILQEAEKHSQIYKKVNTTIKN